MHTGISIELPLPNTAKLSHNVNRSRAKDILVKGMRELAMAEGLRVRGRDLGMSEGASVIYCFYFPDNRVRDEANYIHACKPYMDGLVDAGLIADDRWQFLSTKGVESSIDRKNPRAVLIFSPK